MDHESMTNNIVKPNGSYGVFSRLQTANWSRARKASAHDLNRYMEKTKRKSKAAFKTQLRQMGGFHIWANGIADVQRRSMMFKYVDLLEAVSQVYNVEDSPAAAIQASMNVISGKEKKIQELLSHNAKLQKSKIAVSNKHGSRSVQVQEIIDEIEENQSRLDVTKQQISSIIEQQLLNALNEYHEWLTQKSIQIQLASLDLKTQIQHNERENPSGFRQDSTKDMITKLSGQLQNKLSKQNACEQDDENSVFKERKGDGGSDIGTVLHVARPASNHVHGPPSPQSLVLQKPRVPTIFERASMMLSRPPKKLDEKVPANSSALEEKDEDHKNIKHQDAKAYDPECSLDVEVSTPREFRAIFKRLPRRRRAWGSKITTNEAERINKMELHNEWAEVEKPEAPEKEFEPEGGDRILNPISSWNRPNGWRF